MPLVTAELSTLISIGLVHVLVAISPGPSFLVTARTAAAKSRFAGFKVGLGIGAGTVIWSSAALLGLNVLFHAVPMLFLGMKIVGALFILWIALQIFRHAADPIVLDGSAGQAVSSPFMSGFLTQISNPKAAVFFGSIFIAMLPSAVPLWMTMALIAIVAFNEIWWYTIVALFFGAGPVRRLYIKAKVWIDRGTGLFLGALGLRLLWGARDAA
jgi:threonine/homoserine/homoserine lactone efflux protein